MSMYATIPNQSFAGIIGVNSIAQVILSPILIGIKLWTIIGVTIRPEASME